jgi:hypothetical protein
MKATSRPPRFPSRAQSIHDELARRAAARYFRRLARRRRRRSIGRWIDEEVDRLPEDCRLAVVLCDLGGHSLAEAAAFLAWTPPQVRRNLRRGRRLLQQRLAGAGLRLSLGRLVRSLRRDALAGGLAPTLLAATIRAAQQVTQSPDPSTLPARR